ncbi:MAG: hypothetical protein IKS42_00955 [Oscillospiraceae bacterium]|nr:hypothetical protein [Oscillospiraceae bacterium]
MKRNKITTVIFAGMLLTACQQNPDSGIVVHKDMEKVIAEASTPDDSKVELADLKTIPSRYEQDLFSDKLNISAHIHADVNVPDVDALSLLRVKPHEITQQEVDILREHLLGEAVLYDMVEYSRQTRTEIEKRIAELRDEISRIEARDSDPLEKKTLLEAEQKLLDEYQAEYENAPAEPPMIPSDGKLISTKEKEAQIGYQRFSVMTRNPDGALLWAENADHTAGIYVQNNPDYGSLFTFSASPVGTQEYVSDMASLYPLEPNITPPFDKSLAKEMPENFIYQERYFEAPLRQIDGDSCTLSQADAEAQAEALLQKIGCSDYGFCEGGKYTELLYDYHDEQHLGCYYRTCYILRYCRMIGSVALDPHSGAKVESHEPDEPGESDYTERIWASEFAEFTITDSGIVGFRWASPIDVTETVIDSAVMKPFDEIRSTFERMLLITKTNENYPVRISIDNVSLNYTRISERDVFDRALIVPVWNFSGTCDALTNDSILKERAEETGQTPLESVVWTNRGVQLSINAIDGTVINSALGY